MCVWVCTTAHSHNSGPSLVALGVYIITVFFHQGIWRVCTIIASLEDSRGFYKPMASCTSSFKHYSQGWISFSLTDLRIFKWFRQSAALFFWILPYKGFLALLAMIVLNTLLLLFFSLKHFNLLTSCYLLSFLCCHSIVPFTAMIYVLHLLMLQFFIKTAEIPVWGTMPNSADNNLGSLELRFAPVNSKDVFFLLLSCRHWLDK